MPRAEHPISRSNISRAALKVLYRLKDAGFQSFLVGGAVRDMLLGLRPKDFDIATDAEPEQVHDLFRNSRMIGRRFRIVHVRFGREIIEVATFRAASSGDTGGDSQSDDEGRLLRDNVYGTIDEDVWRRDFTANALYYNIADFTIWDYVGGVRDVEARRLELIGDPETRLREDPVRVLRAVRFAAKLDFSLDPALQAAIDGYKDLLVNVPAARLFDEFLKMFQAGFARQSFALLRKYRVFRELFPDTWAALEADEDGSFERFIERALENTDARIAADKPVTPMFLLGVFLWGPIRGRAEGLREEKRMGEVQALGLAAFELISRQQQIISLPRRFTSPMREMLTMQPRFHQQRGKRGLRLLEHRRFRAAYDFMLLRSEVGEVDPAVATFWTEVQELDGDARAQAFGVGGGRHAERSGEEASEAAPRGRRRRPRRRRSGGDG